MLSRSREPLQGFGVAPRRARTLAVLETLYPCRRANALSSKALGSYPRQGGYMIIALSGCVLVKAPALMLLASANWAPTFPAGTRTARWCPSPETATALASPGTASRRDGMLSLASLRLAGSWILPKQGCWAVGMQDDFRPTGHTGRVSGGLPPSQNRLGAQALRFPRSWAYSGPPKERF